VEDSVEGTCDAALVELKRPISEFTLSVHLPGNGGTVKQVELPARPTKNQPVSKFDGTFGEDASLGFVLYPSYDVGNRDLHVGQD